MHATANASLPFVEQIVPPVDGELAYPLLVFLLWAAGRLPWYGASKDRKADNILIRT
ncbi:MAG: hypothetical protein R3282_09750 [Rhodothermales bacterium]|nr:hypothetical protein [Rhodothermales bacterium]